ncbi:hypothetical protein [Parasutterella excrementihominis]|uniref:hypothetical protein n=1 Tax=Parasutterella excrementihominis TaxID=487175 RepID=UPI002672DF0D|nr:hypothetical protein [Parasutterella excrementihominis]
MSQACQVKVFDHCHCCFHIRRQFPAPQFMGGGHDEVPTPDPIYTVPYLVINFVFLV